MDYVILMRYYVITGRFANWLVERQNDISPLQGLTNYPIPS